MSAIVTRNCGVPPVKPDCVGVSTTRLVDNDDGGSAVAASATNNRDSPHATRHLTTATPWEPDNQLRYQGVRTAPDTIANRPW